MEKNMISFIIPCYRSEHTIELVVEEIIKIVSQKDAYQYEIILVNDNSPDNVLQTLKSMASKNLQLKIIDLADNFGKQSAVMAGLSMIKGDYVVCLDDDYQCPMDHFWDLMEPLKQGYDIAMAQYGVKKQSWFRNLGSRMTSTMFQVLLSKPKTLQLTNFYIFKRFIAEEMQKYENPYPYLHGLLLRTTKKIAGVPMEERERAYGTSGYTFKKLFRFWCDGFTGFSVKPLHIAIIMGFLFSALGAAYGLFLIIHWFIQPSKVAGWTSLMALMLFIGGTILVVLGILGEYVGRIYLCINNTPQYVIRDTINI